MIKVVNRRVSGALFHYAHFMCDCLFPEIVNDLFMYPEVVRQKTIHQTLGNFSKIYTDVMMIKNTELLPNEFNELNVDTILYGRKELYYDRKSFDKFRNYIFSRYKINELEYITGYPEVILIKRGKRKCLIDDEYLKNKTRNITTGRERREIDRIDDVEQFMKEKYGDNFKSIYFEDIDFKDQVLYFNNAKFIVCSHGAVMSNMWFCKEGTTIIEVGGGQYECFNQIAKILNLKLITQRPNKYPNIINCIKMNGI